MKISLLITFGVTLISYFLYFPVFAFSSVPAVSASPAPAASVSLAPAVSSSSAPAASASLAPAVSASPAPAASVSLAPAVSASPAPAAPASLAPAVSPFPDSTSYPIQEIVVQEIPVQDLLDGMESLFQDYVSPLALSNSVTSFNSYILSYMSGVVNSLPSDYAYVMIPTSDSYNAKMLYGSIFYVNGSQIGFMTDYVELDITRTYSGGSYIYNVTHSRSGRPQFFDLSTYAISYSNAVIGYPSLGDSFEEKYFDHFYRFGVLCMLFMILVNISIVKRRFKQ